jgi:hypothetical protein
MKPTVWIAVIAVAFPLVVATGVCADETRRGASAPVPNAPAPEDTQGPGIRPQERGIPDVTRQPPSYPTSGASRSDTPTASGSTTTIRQ